MGIDLYYLPGSAPCRAVLLTAKAVGVELNLKLTNLMAGEHLTPEFLAVNNFFQNLHLIFIVSSKTNLIRFSFLSFLYIYRSIHNTPFQHWSMMDLLYGNHVLFKHIW